MIFRNLKQNVQKMIQVYVLNLFNTHHEFISEAEVIINFLIESPLNVIFPLIINVGLFIICCFITYKTARDEVPKKYFLSWAPGFLGMIFV